MINNEALHEACLFFLRVRILDGTNSERWPRCRTALGASGPQQSPSVVARAIGLGVSATRRERSARWLPYWPRSCYGDPCPRCGDDCFGGSTPTLTREEVGKAKTSSEAQA